VMNFVIIFLIDVEISVVTCIIILLED